MIRLVIFDLDGTLLDTIDDLGNAGNHILQTHGLPVHSLDEYRYFVGNGITKLIERTLPEELRDERFIHSLREEFIAYYTEHAEEYTRPYEGITDMLGELQRGGVKMAVASNKFDAATRSLVERFFGGFNFSAVYGQREGIPVKPDPRIVFDVMSSAGIDDTGSILYVGDTNTDMLTAKNAGLASVGVIWGFRPREELAANGATYIVDRPGHIADIVLRKG